MASRVKVLEELACVLSTVVEGRAGLARDIPGTVRVLEAHTGQAGQAGPLTPGQGEALHLVLTQHHHAPPHTLHQDVAHSDVEREELDLLYESGPVLSPLGVRHEFQDPAPGRPDEDDVHQLSGGGHHGRVHSYGGQSLVGAGFDIVRTSRTVGRNTEVHQNIFFQKVEMFVIELFRIGVA